MLVSGPTVLLKMYLHPCENMDQKTLSSFWNQWGLPLAFVIYTVEDKRANDKLSPPVDHPKIRLHL